MPTTASSTGLGWFSGLFRKDPSKKEISQSIYIIDRMIKNLESSKKNLETVVENHKKNLNFYSDDQDMARIINEEINNIGGYMNIIDRAIKQLSAVKYRLETLLYVKEPLTQLPLIVQELQSVEPLIQQINPNLMEAMWQLQQKVSSLMTASSSTSILGIQPKIPENTQVARENPGILNGYTENTSRQREIPVARETPTSVIKEKKTIQTPSSPSPAIPEAQKEIATTSKPSQPTRIESREENTAALVEKNIPLHIIEEWILQELRVNNGVLDLKTFEHKYGVSRKLVFEALNSLESKGLIRLRRKQ